jgi:hypothetical protein
MKTKCNNMVGNRKGLPLHKTIANIACAFGAD